MEEGELKKIISREREFLKRDWRRGGRFYSCGCVSPGLVKYEVVIEHLQLGFFFASDHLHSTITRQKSQIVAKTGQQSPCYIAKDKSSYPSPIFALVAGSAFSQSTYMATPPPLPLLLQHYIYFWESYTLTCNKFKVCTSAFAQACPLPPTTDSHLSLFSLCHSQKNVNDKFLGGSVIL